MFIQTQYLLRSHLLYLSGLFVAAFVLFFSFLWPPSALLALGITVIFLFFALFPWLGLLLMIFFHPYLDWQIRFGNANAPIVDLLAIVLFFGTLIHLFLKPRQHLHIPWFLFLSFGIFLASLLPSFFVTEDFCGSVKYLIRPILFFFLMFILLPILIIRDKKTLISTLWIFLPLALIIASMGFVSLFMPPNTGTIWKRAIPLSFGSFAPLGYNHNLLAESLVAAIPIIGYLTQAVRSLMLKRVLFLSLLFASAISLLTFSRAGFLALLVQACLFILFRYRNQLRQAIFCILLFFVLISPFVVLLFSLQNTPAGRIANSNRIMMWEIALDAFAEHPWIGNGLGQFQHVLAQNTAFRIQYGDALDAHGVWQKLIVETGVVGTLGFLFFVGTVFIFVVRTWKKNERDGARVQSETGVKEFPQYSDLLRALFLSSAGIFVFQWFNTSYFVGKMWLPVGLAIAASVLMKNVKKTADSLCHDDVFH